MSDSAYRLLLRASWMAECMFKQRRGQFRSQLWITECADGRCERFETKCEVAADKRAVDDATVLQMLESDQAADFAHDRVVGFAVAYPARVTKSVVKHVLQRVPDESKREAIVIEAHAGEHLLMVRDIYRYDGRPYLAAAEKVEVDEGRFAGVLPGHVRHLAAATETRSESSRGASRSRRRNGENSPA